jgi:hypothetical protein
MAIRPLIILIPIAFRRLFFGFQGGPAASQGVT